MSKRERGLHGNNCPNTGSQVSALERYHHPLTSHTCKLSRGLAFFQFLFLTPPHRISKRDKIWNTGTASVFWLQPQITQSPYHRRHRKVSSPCVLRLTRNGKALGFLRMVFKDHTLFFRVLIFFKELVLCFCRTICLGLVALPFPQTSCPLHAPLCSNSGNNEPPRIAHISDQIVRKGSNSRLESHSSN